MLCTTRHLWPSEYVFTLNCYQHHTQLIVGAPCVFSDTISSLEDITHSDFFHFVVCIGVPSNHLAYSIVMYVLPYAESSGYFDRIWAFWECLFPQGSSRGYFLGTNKSILVADTCNLGKSMEYSDMDFKVNSGNHYLVRCMSNKEGGGLIIQIESQHLGWIHLPTWQGGHHPPPHCIHRIPMVTPRLFSVTAVHHWGGWGVTMCTCRIQSLDISSQNSL